MSYPDITLDQAREVVAMGEAEMVRLVEAADAICYSPDATWDDVLACLRLPGLPREVAACFLYWVTKRPRSGPFDMDSGSWMSYLSEHGFRSASLATVRLRASKAVEANGNSTDR